MKPCAMMKVGRVLAAALVLVSASLHSLAADSADSFALSLPWNATAATPAWLGQPVMGKEQFASILIPITPPDSTSSLLMTVFFEEQNGGFLRISWQSSIAPATEGDSSLPGPGETSLSSVLSDNFYEGIGMKNQRSLLIPAQAIKGCGALCLQAGASTLGISRIEFQWLQNSTGLASPSINEVMVTPSNGLSVPASELAGQPALAESPAWSGRIVNVPVTDVPLRIEQGLDFTVQLDGVPTGARISLKEAGLPWGQHLVVWVNNQRTGMVIPATPPLDNGGYARDGNGIYIGWREGTFFVPTAALANGANTLQFSAEPDVSSGASADPNLPPAPLALKDVALQLAYSAPAPVTSNAGAGVGNFSSSATGEAGGPNAAAVTGSAVPETALTSTAASVVVPSTVAPVSPIPALPTNTPVPPSDAQAVTASSPVSSPSPSTAPAPASSSTTP